MKPSIFNRQNIIRSFLKALLTLALLFVIRWILSTFMNIHLFSSDRYLYYLIFFIMIFLANLISNGKDITWKEVSKSQKNEPEN